jgi:hypothetical protein
VGKSLKFGELEPGFSPWQSTSQAAYVRKAAKFGATSKETSEIAEYIKQSHFTLSGHPGYADKFEGLSATRQDYADFGNAAYARKSRHHTAVDASGGEASDGVVAAGGHKDAGAHYPPIMGDETITGFAKDSTYSASFRALVGVRACSNFMHGYHAVNVALF